MANTRCICEGNIAERAREQRVYLHSTNASAYRTLVPALGTERPRQTG